MFLPWYSTRNDCWALGDWPNCKRNLLWVREKKKEWVRERESISTRRRVYMCPVSFHSWGQSHAHFTIQLAEVKCFYLLYFPVRNIVTSCKEKENAYKSVRFTFFLFPSSLIFTNSTHKLYVTVVLTRSLDQSNWWHHQSINEISHQWATKRMYIRWRRQRIQVKWNKNMWVDRWI